MDQELLVSQSASGGDSAGCGRVVAGRHLPADDVGKRIAEVAAYRGDFIAQWLHDLLFFDAEPWVFTMCYTLFGLAVLATFVLAPPRWRKAGGRPDQTCPM